MTATEILIQINEIFIDILENEAIVLDENTTANDVDDWDSLTHIMIVVAIENHFKKKFSSKEILTWQNIGEMVSSVKNKI